MLASEGGIRLVTPLSALGRTFANSTSAAMLAMESSPAKSEVFSSTKKIHL